VVLNRIIRWTAEGLEYEADPRQAEKLVTECGLTGSNTMATPGSEQALRRSRKTSRSRHTSPQPSAARRREPTTCLQIVSIASSRQKRSADGCLRPVSSRGQH
jgi:hypothetical protein